MPPAETKYAREFPVVNNHAYLNHAAVAPWPKRTYDAVKDFCEENLHHGAACYPAWMKIEEKLRGQLARLMGAATTEIALLKNTSEGLSVVAHGFPWRAGDNVVISDEEFPSNRIVWESLTRYGVTVKQINLRLNHAPEENLIRAIDERTRLLSVSSVQYASGLRLDLLALGQACAARKVAFCVDAIQGLGVVAHDVNAMHIDFLVADGHKWLLGPEGVAVFYCRENWRDRLRLHQYGWHMVRDRGNYDNKTWQTAVDAKRFECGSPNLLGIHALSASLSLIQEVGAGKIEKSVCARSAYLLEALAQMKGVELVTRHERSRTAGIVTFKLKNGEHEKLFRRLQKKNVVCALRGGGLRFSPHFYTPMKQLDEVLALIS
jgi:selenocysteine lyase/cysteine desulfurase